MSANPWGKHLKIVLGESVVASSAATFSVMALELPVWAMFVGWIAFFTRGLNLRSGLVNLACVLIGLALGTFASLGLAAAIGTTAGFLAHVWQHRVNQVH